MHLHIFLAVMTARKFPLPCHSHESASVLVAVHSWDCSHPPSRTCCRLILVALSFGLSSSMAILGGVVVQGFNVGGHCYGDGEGVDIIVVVGGSGCGRSGIGVADGIIVAGVDVRCCRGSP